MNAARKPYKSPQVVQLSPIHHINTHTHTVHVEKGLYYHLLKRMVFRKHTVKDYRQGLIIPLRLFDFLLLVFLCILLLLEQYGETRPVLQNDFTVIAIEVSIG
jgi:hypothetical protein